MSKNYTISKETESEGNFLTDMMFLTTVGMLDLSNKKEVIKVVDNNTGDKFKFNNSKDAENFIKNH